MEEFWDEIRKPVLDYGGQVLAALVLLVLGWLALRLLARPIRMLLEHSRLGPSAGAYVASLAHSAFVVVLVLAVLHQLGVQTASLVTLLGAAGLAVALSLQNMLANFTSGILLISYRLFRVGDQIEVNDLRGRVSEMLAFHIILVTQDNQRISVPNSILTSSPVRNNSALPQRRLQWTLPLTPDDDLAAVKEAMRTCVVQAPGVLTEPAPQIYVQEWTADKRVLAVAVWTPTENYQTLQQEMLEDLGTCLDEFRKRAKEASESRPA